MEWWDLIQLGIMVLGIPGLYIYQHYKIKGLKDQIQSKDEILNSAKKLMKMHNPELLKHRTEQYEELLQKEKDIAIKKMQDEMQEKIEKAAKSEKEKIGMVTSLLNVCTEALVEHPPEKRLQVLNRFKDQSLKELFEKSILPKFEKYDAQRHVAYGNISFEGSVNALTSDQAEFVKKRLKELKTTDKKED
jgi:hypothetical protein